MAYLFELYAGLDLAGIGVISYNPGKMLIFYFLHFDCFIFLKMFQYGWGYTE